MLDAGGRLGVTELVALIDAADLLVANDTAPVHVGSATGTPVLGIYGPNTPTLYGPLSPGSRAFYSGLPCSPCLTAKNYRTSLCRMPVCVLGIAVADVAEHAGRVLAARSYAESSPGSVGGCA